MPSGDYKHYKKSEVSKIQTCLFESTFILEATALHKEEVLEFLTGSALLYSEGWAELDYVWTLKDETVLWRWNLPLPQNQDLDNTGMSATGICGICKTSNSCFAEKLHARSSGV